ncbi:MAG: Serine-type D-Ala-D-Ala carboxypeptidase [Candidatus Peribacteria bacterium GW2011_GWC2_54_8]|nr:MAG: Serine-type D-Ala-D-Ala carboxypeptidase [Candidatus Peribacteria bacterium GW2011_GWC2_54_8]
MLDGMYHSILSVLFLGMIPAAMHPVLQLQPLDISVAPPASLVLVSERLSASGVVIMDVESGQQLYGRQQAVRRPMASITKLMTALLIVENHEMDELVIISQDVEDVEGNIVHLPSGEQFTVGDLLSALLISSSHSMTEASFVFDMNIRAKALGLKGTSFANPSGLDHPRQWSTPQDLAWLTISALRHPEIRERMGQSSKMVYSKQGTAISLSHTHAMLHGDTPISGGKTGTTDAAGQCLVSVVEQDGREYVVVLLHSLQRYRDMQSILAAIAPVSPVISAAQLPAA